MDDESQRESQGKRPPGEAGGSESGSGSSASQQGDGESSHGEIPAQLQNWQVIEIDGEATIVEEGDGVGSPARSHAPAGDLVAIEEHYDDAVVVIISERRLAVEAGKTVVLETSVLNNGEWPAIFELTVEGWIDERWLTGVPVRIPLKSGERRKVPIPITPPRVSASRAGEHPLAVVVRADSYPGRYSRAGVSLVIRAYDELQVGPMRPRRLSSSWFQRADTLILPLTNAGNRPAQVQIYGTDRHHECKYEFLRPGIGRSDHGQARVEVEPGQSVQIPVQISPIQQPLFGLFAKVIPFWIVASLSDSREQRSAVEGQLVCNALVGPWQLAGLASMVVLAIVGLGLAGLAVLLALRSEPPPPLAAQPVAEAPIVAFVLKVDEPVPTRAPPTTATGVADPAANEEPVTLPPQVVRPDSGVASVPVVSADQVTAPGESTPMNRAPSVRPTALVVAPPIQSRMTYAQMFQVVAQEYDFNWRMLAAQAYVESGFDSLALGSYGDLGLMQIRPSTWQEWAPLLDVEDPFDSYSNVLVGAAYLDYLRNMFAKQGYPQQEWMLVAYNWGPDKLAGYLRSGGTWDGLGPELQGYVQDVMRIAENIPTN